MENVEKQDLGKLINLLQEIEPIKEIDDKKREKESFNIFSALHRIDDEVRLHSRFIAYLLSPNSQHGQENKFAKEFINNVLKIKEKEFDLDNYSVYPNEFDKSEKYNIDILLIDNKNKKAIIIENKTRYSTPDSNDYKTKRKGYQGQLERYYNTIHTGKDSEEKEIEEEFQCENPDIFYLSVNKRKATDESLGTTLKGKDIVKYIHYEDSIKQWLDQCIYATEGVLKDVIMQYKEIVINMTARVEENKKLKEIVSKNYCDDVMKIFRDTEKFKRECEEYTDAITYLNEKFSDIKWHTIDDFWIALREKLVESKYKNIHFFKSYVSALNKISCGKNKLIGLHFGIKEEDNSFLYVAYDEHNGLTLGRVEKQENEEIKNWKKFEGGNIGKINFLEFKNKETFALMNNEKMKEVVDKIVDEIKKEKDSIFVNLKKV